MTFPVEILTRQNAIISDQRRLDTRSKGVVAFTCLLLWKKRTQPGSAWVGIEELRTVLPSVHGRQLQRHIDALAGIDFPVEYESKTRGRYRLTLPAEQVRVDVDENALAAFIGLRAERAPARKQPAATGMFPGDLADNRRLLDSFSRLNLADSQYHDGSLGADANQAYHLYLRESESAPPELRAIALLRLARTCRRLSRHDEAMAALRRMEKLLRDSGTQPAGLEMKLQLCRAMAHFDQGRIVQAAAIAAKLDMRACADASTLGEYHNLMGLLAHRELRARRSTPANPAPEQEAYSALLEIAAHHFRLSLTHHIGVSDYQAMQATSFNLGNLFLFAWMERLPEREDEPFLELGVKWVAQCEFICNKFGVGMDSVWSRIVLIKTALQSNLGLDSLNGLTGGLFRNHAGLEDLAWATLTEIEVIGNRMEQAELQGLLAQLALARGDAVQAKTCRERALALYNEMKRPDLIQAMKRDFPENRLQQDAGG